MGMNQRLLRTRASGFNPKSISGLAAWWDASDSSTITTVSGAVSQWNDKSGNGLNATQTTANNRPSNSAQTLNGRAVMTFDGSNDVLQFTGVARTDETWFLVGAANSSAASSKAHVMLGNASPGHGLHFVPKLDGGATNILGYLGGFGAANTARYDIAGGGNVAATLVSVVRSAASGGTMWTNGVQRGSCSTSSSTTMDRLGLPSTGTAATCFISEALIYSRPLSTAERRLVESWLGKKWGIAVA
jgi:hypothetical protein